MPEVPVYEYKSQAARDLADLGAISRDLSRLLAYLKLLIGQKDATLQEALFTAALITYRRCFTHGARARLHRDEVAKLWDGAADLHDYYLAMADKFAAHSVNPFEQMKAGVLIHDDAVFGAAAFFFRTLSYSDDDLRSWGHHVALLLAVVQEKGSHAEARMLSEAKERPIKDLVRANVMRITTPPSTEVKIRRD